MVQISTVVAGEPRPIRKSVGTKFPPPTAEELNVVLSARSSTKYRPYSKITTEGDCLFQLGWDNIQQLQLLEAAPKVLSRNQIEFIT